MNIRLFISRTIDYFSFVVLVHCLVRLLVGDSLK